MPGEKTEQPTEQRIREARKKGQVFQSRDITQAISFLTGASIVAGAGAIFIQQLTAFLRESFQPELIAAPLEPALLLDRTGAAFQRWMQISLPVAGALAAVTAVTIFLQVKALFSFEIVKPKFEKINPLEGFKNIFFSAKTYIQLGKSIVSFAIVLTIAYFYIKDSLYSATAASRLSLFEAAGLGGELLAGLLLRAGGVFLILGAADYFLQKHLYMKGQMMSKEDVKQEYKQNEGDPHIKQMRRHLHEEALKGAAVKNVAGAAVVVVNPTHIAVALAYDSATMNAPRVVAKGAGDLATRIRELAAEYKVPILQNVSLARRLHAVGLEQEIPEELFDAVAEVLQWVYQLRKERGE
jgi:type III secretion YscU/HrpY family protein